MPRAAALLAALALAVGCSSAPEPEARVTLAEYVIGAPGELPAGPSVLAVTNRGEAHHNLSICPSEDGGATCAGDPVPHRLLERPEEARDPSFYDEVGDSLTLGKRWSAVLEVDLEPGTYRFFCGIVGHAERGMHRTVTVPS